MQDDAEIKNMFINSNLDNNDISNVWYNFWNKSIGNYREQIVNGDAKFINVRDMPMNTIQELQNKLIALNKIKKFDKNDLSSAITFAQDMKEVRNSEKEGEIKNVIVNSGISDRDILNFYAQFIQNYLRRFNGSTYADAYLAANPNANKSSPLQNFITGESNSVYNVFNLNDLANLIIYLNQFMPIDINSLKRLVDKWSVRSKKSYQDINELVSKNISTPITNQKILDAGKNFVSVYGDSGLYSKEVLDNFLKSTVGSGDLVTPPGITEYGNPMVTKQDLNYAFYVADLVRKLSDDEIVGVLKGNVDAVKLKIADDVKKKAEEVKAKVESNLLWGLPVVAWVFIFIGIAIVLAVIITLAVIFGGKKPESKAAVNAVGGRNYNYGYMLRYV